MKLANSFPQGTNEELKTKIQHRKDFSCGDDQEFRIATTQDTRPLCSSKFPLKNLAATVIQSAYRSYRVRKNVKSKNLLKERILTQECKLTNNDSYDIEQNR